MKSLITNIQRFCVSDGPGIRTTVFFKGCPLHCPWCANPENIKAEQQIYYVREKCSERCSYSNFCKAYHNNVPEETDIQHCNYRAVEYVGKYYSQEQLFNELVKDRKYFEPMGGITFSGGEALLFLPEYDEMVEKLRKQKISTAVETCLMVPVSHVQWAVDKIDYFYIDIKIVDPVMCKKILGGDGELFESNLIRISEHVDTKRIVYRMPVVPELTDTEENINRIVRIVTKYPPRYMEIFSVHNLGEKKYERIGIPYKKWNMVQEGRLLEIKDQIEQAGINCRINSL